MPLDIADKQIIAKSLIHYFETFGKILTEEELPEIAKIDLINECKVIGKARDEVTSIPKNDEEAGRSYSYTLDDPDYNRVIHAALNCYIKDLEESRNKLSECSAKISLNFTSTDLELASMALNKITSAMDRTSHQSHYNTTAN